MTLELHSLSPLQLQVKGSFVRIALMVRCGFIELLCVDGEPAFFKLATGPAKPPIINHVLSPFCSQTEQSRCSWTFCSPPSLGEDARIHTHKHTLGWIYCRPTGYAGEGEGMLKQDCLLVQRTTIFTTIAARHLVSVDIQPPQRRLGLLVYKLVPLLKTWSSHPDQDPFFLCCLRSALGVKLKKNIYMLKNDLHFIHYAESTREPCNEP